MNKRIFVLLVYIIWGSLLLQLIFAFINLIWFGVFAIITLILIIVTYKPSDEFCPDDSECNKIERFIFDFPKLYFAFALITLIPLTSYKIIRYRNEIRIHGGYYTTAVVTESWKSTYHYGSNRYATLKYCDYNNNKVKRTIEPITQILDENDTVVIACGVDGSDDVVFIAKTNTPFDISKFAFGVFYDGYETDLDKIEDDKNLRTKYLGKDTTIIDVNTNVLGDNLFTNRFLETVSLEIRNYLIGQREQYMVNRLAKIINVDPQILANSHKILFNNPGIRIVFKAYPDRTRPWNEPGTMFNFININGDSATVYYNDTVMTKQKLIYKDIFDGNQKYYILCHYDITTPSNLSKISDYGYMFNNTIFSKELIEESFPIIKQRIEEYKEHYRNSDEIIEDPQRVIKLYNDYDRLWR